MSTSGEGAGDRITNGDLLADALAELGVGRLYGSAGGGPSLQSFGDLTAVDPGDPDLALLLADCDGRVNGSWGAALVDGQILHLSSQPGGTARPRTITSIDGLVAALVEAELDTTPRTLAFELDLDLDEPVADDLELSGRPDGGVLMTLSPSLADLRTMLIVGPGVARGHLDAIREFATRGGFGVFNTWGAKGVFRWDSPFHFGTVGLQAGDLDHMGLDDVDLIVTSGLDPAELSASAIAAHTGALLQDLPPWQLGAALADWPKARREPAGRPPLYDRIASIVTPYYERDTGDVSAPRAALQLAGAAPDDAVIVAGADTAGYWLARTFPTGVPGSMVVPAVAQPGSAIGGALAARLAGRPALAVVSAATGVDGEIDRALLDAARELEVAVAVQVWGDPRDPGDGTSAARHVELTTAGFAADAPRVDHVGVDESAGAELFDALGPIVAWDGSVRLDS